MLFKSSVVLAFSVSALALSINTPSSLTSGGTASITWTSATTDPVFTIELNHPSFNMALAIANNVDPANNNITISLPPLPAEPNYTLQFVNVTDITDVFATSSSFSIAAAASASAVPSVTGSGAQPSATAPAASGSASAFAASGSAAASGSGSATASGASSSSTGSAAAASFRAPAALVVSVVGALLGTAMVL